MAERKSKVRASEASCDVEGCSKPVDRSVAAKKFAKAKIEGAKVSTQSGNVHLCKDHYKDYKKATKEDRKLERLGW